MRRHPNLIARLYNAVDFTVAGILKVSALRTELALHELLAREIAVPGVCLAEHFPVLVADDDSMGCLLFCALVLFGAKSEHLFIIAFEAPAVQFRIANKFASLQTVHGAGNAFLFDGAVARSLVHFKNLIAVEESKRHALFVSVIDRRVNGASVQKQEVPNVIGLLEARANLFHQVFFRIAVALALQELHVFDPVGVPIEPVQIPKARPEGIHVAVKKLDLFAVFKFFASFLENDFRGTLFFASLDKGVQHLGAGELRLFGIVEGTGAEFKLERIPLFGIGNATLGSLYDFVQISVTFTLGHFLVVNGINRCDLVEFQKELFIERSQVRAKFFTRNAVEVNFTCVNGFLILAEKRIQALQRSKALRLHPFHAKVFIRCTRAGLRNLRFHQGKAIDRRINDRIRRNFRHRHHFWRS